MSKTVVGLFDDFNDAQGVVQELVNVGFRRGDISLAANQTATGYTGDGTDLNDGTDASRAVGKDVGIGAGVGGVVGLLVGLASLTVPGIGPVLAAGPIAAALGTAVGSTVVGAGIGAVAGGLIGGLTHLGVPQEQAEYYSEGVRRGGTLVTVSTDDARAEEAVDIMNGRNAVDIDERSTAYRSTGYTGYDESASPYASEDITRERGQYRTAPLAATDTTANANGETVIPIVQEDVAIGKRQVQSGGARIHTYVTEWPVDESISLHEEHVTVERRPVDRPADEAELGFAERSFEVTETTEVPIVAKAARVVEEVVVGKTATDRNETIHDTVRRTNVDVEELETTHASDLSNLEEDDTLDTPRTANTTTGRGTGI